MRSLGKMGFAVLPERAFLLVSLFYLALIWNASGQNVAPNTTTSTPVPMPSSTSLTPDEPLSPPSTDPSSTMPNGITCCYIQSACNNCSEVYHVNSISYCCPNCRGMVLVTDLVCRCTIPKGYQVSDLKCKMSDKVVGNYVALKPSYYDAGGSWLRASSAFLFTVLLAVVAL